MTLNALKRMERDFEILKELKSLNKESYGRGNFKNVLSLCGKYGVKKAKIYRMAAEFEAFKNERASSEEPAPPKVQQWHDGEKENPPTSGQYLCLVKWYGNTTHYRALANYNADTESWELSDSCEHLYWTDIPDNPTTEPTT